MNGPAADGRDHTWLVLCAQQRARTGPGHRRWGGRTERDFSPHIFIWSSYSLQAEAEVVQTDWRELKGRDVWQLVWPTVSPLSAAAQPGESDSGDWWWCFSQYFVISLAFHMFYILNQGSAGTQRSFFIFRNIFSL